jgi:hypothetical protein
MVATTITTLCNLLTTDPKSTTIDAATVMSSPSIWIFNNNNDCEEENDVVVDEFYDCEEENDVALHD